MESRHPRSRCPCGSKKRFKDCCQNRKPRSQSLTFDLGEPATIDGVSFGPDGEIRLLAGGKPVAPVRSWSGSHRERDKGGEKNLFRIPKAGGVDRVGELETLSDYDHIFVIDTNTARIRGEHVSIASLAQCKVIADAGGPGATLMHKAHVGAFEFRGLQADQERFGWLLLQNAFVNGPSFDPRKRCLLVTDHALLEHDAINERRTYIFGDTMLAAGLTMGYATSDSGQGFLQKTIRECDRFAKHLLREVREGRSDEFLHPTIGGPISHLRLYTYNQPAERHPLQQLVPLFILSADLPFVEIPNRPEKQ